MRRVLVVFIFACAVATAVSAERTAAVDSLPAEIAAALAEMSSTQVGTLTVGDLEGLAERISIAAQKTRYVQRVRMASWIMPGAGQFMTGDVGSGALFALGNLAIAAGTMTAIYFLLPSDLQFGTTNYFTDSIDTIQTRWKSKSLVDYLPAMGAMTGGVILRGVLGKFASANAAETARRNIAEGKITFTPFASFMGRGFGMGMRWRY
jgi:hypothetical protein